MGLGSVRVLGLAGIPLNYAVLNRLLAIVLTLRAGEAFVAADAHRSQAIRGRCSPYSLNANLARNLIKDNATSSITSPLSIVFIAFHRGGRHRPPDVPDGVSLGN
jgi:hypothetical protein